ncbi:MAG: Cytochrome c heme lyase subunit CcmL [uncultured Craurococcus sp.]|jgi:cytochrome c-type biogenesis protein CcmH|uniref:Cytochrome c-type biogenesis protein n=1 Tax=uncultured Craurococcus sp. TaxID=1135998 RepID=A0A6J4H6N2_9PROT|nr:MAG: Cytochrome c heme lyase subunit CcmL [uncultured Craurococcus sp.]
MIRWLLLLMLAVMPAPGPALAVGDPADQLPNPALEERARVIGRELRCMVCQNQSIEDSDADLARDLRRIVREQVAQGKPDEAVLTFVHERYGDFVLLRPPFKPETALLWATPAIALLAGALLIRGMRRRQAAAAGPPDLTQAERDRLAQLAGRPRE